VIASVGGANIGVQSTPAASILMNVRTHSWSMSRLYLPQGRRARSSGEDAPSLSIPLKRPASALPIPTTIPMIQPATGMAETALSAKSIATLAIAPTSIAGSAVTANGTSAKMPAMASVFGLIHATLDHTSPRRSPAIVALVFQSICVA
jgi:hypothetical protein